MPLSVRLHRRRFLTLAAALALPSLACGQAGPQAGNTPRLKIGIIGSGRIGGTLGTLWVKAGHEVLFSSRHPEQLTDLVAGLGSLARAGTPEEAAQFGDAVLLAVPYKAYPDIGRDHAAALANRIVLDAGNAVPARDGDIAGEAKLNGIGRTSAKYLPGARIVRAFNTLGYGVLAREANRKGGLIAIPLAGDDAEALSVASELVRAAGFDPVVVGGLARADEFAQGAPGYGRQVTAPELRSILGL